MNKTIIIGIRLIVAALTVPCFVSPALGAYVNCEALTGGGTSPFALDRFYVAGESGTYTYSALAVGSKALVITSNDTIYIYRISSSGAAEDSPRVVKPDWQSSGNEYTGDLRWHLVSYVGAGFQSGAADGSHYLRVSNTGDPTYSSPQEGDVAWDAGENKFQVHNGTNWTTWYLLTNGHIGSVVQGYDSDLASLGSGITGIVKGAGDSGGYSAATAGTDYVTGSSTNTLTNKTFDGDGTGNALSNIDAANVKAILKTDGITVGLGNGSDAITTGTKSTRAFAVPYKHDLGSITLITDGNAGNITIDVWVDEGGATDGLDAVTDADSLFDTASEPTIADASSDNHVTVTSFDSGEATDIPANSWYVINVDSASTLANVSVLFTFTRKD